MGKCVNINSEKFKSLVEDTKLPAHSLAIEISLYQDKNNTDEFPSVEFLQANTALSYDDAVQEFKEKYHLDKSKNLFPKFEIPKKLVDSGRDNPKYDQIQFGVKSSSAGFSVAFNPKYGQQGTLLQQYNEKQKGETIPELDIAVRNAFEVLGVDLKAVDKIYFNGEEVNAIAKANTLTNTVELIEDKRQRDTLPEELTHIYVDMAGGENNPMILKMMNDVTKFKVYEDVVREYNKVYKGNTILLRKEAVGKVIASYMLNQHTGEPTLDKLGETWWNLLWTKIKSFFVGNKYKSTAFEILNVTKEKAEQLQQRKSVTAEEFFQLNEETTEDIIEEDENIHTKQFVFFKRRIALLEAKLRTLTEESPEYEKISGELETIKQMFEESQEKEDYTDLGRRTLEKVEKFIDRLSQEGTPITEERLEDTYGVLEAFMDYPELASYAQELEKKLFPFTSKLALNLINEHRTEGDEITQEMIDKQTEDIGSVVAYVGAVANSSNYIVRTVGTIVKAAQNRVSVKNKELTHDIQEEIDKLSSWASKNGMTLEQAYGLFIQEFKGTLSLTSKKLEDGTINPNWNKIQKTPELRDFYNFFVKETGVAGNKLHVKIPWNFIPNSKKKKGIIEKWKAEDLETEEFQTQLSEELFADLVSNKAYRTKLKPEDKSRDLGEVLLKFRAFANKYEEMSQVLPQTRILQKQLEKKVTKSGQVTVRNFTKSSDKSVKVLGINSNRWKMVDTYIEMQVKGKMKKDEGKFAKAVDQLMSYNSLLRIGLSPITAISNITYGELSNIIEGVGGRFYTVSDLHNASMIFNKETFNKDSKTNRLLEIINPLQELTDYENISKVRLAKKYSPEKLKEIMYAPQKVGEKFLQTRTMIALMLNSKIKSIDGKQEISLWEAFNEDGSIKEGFEFNEAQISKLRDKIQRLNEMIHGRYSQRDAANASQYVLYRMVSQFRKWISTQVENRVMKEYYDVRLGVNLEGRYRTFNRAFIQELRQKQFGKAFSNLITPLISAKKALESGTLTEMEIYNMRKMMVEIIIAGASLLLFALASGGDDEDEKMKDPLIKFGLTLLNRASSDLTFFYSATQINKLGTNSIPLAKTTGDILEAIYVIPEVLISGEYVYEKGSNKGRYKVEKQIVDVVPILNPIFGQMRRILSENRLEELD